MIVTRKLQFDAASADDDDRSVIATFATNHPVDRGDYIEILSCEPAAVDLSRAPLPLIEGHDTSKVNIGLVEDPSPDGRRVRGRIRFGSTGRAKELWNDVKTGIVRYLSVSYEVLAWLRNGTEWTATHWRPLEVSLVSVPADPHAQIGRNKTMPDSTKSGPDNQSGQQAARLERDRCTEINAIGSHFGCADEAQRAIEAGTSVEAFRQEVLNRLQQRGPRAAASGNLALPDPSLDLSPRDRENYSLVRAIRAAAEKNWGVAPFEHQCAVELERRFGPSQHQNAFRVPLDVLVRDLRSVSPARASGGRRDLSVGTASAGGNLVATENLGASFIDQLRNRAVIFQMGATRLPGLRGNVTIPKQSAPATAYWVLEGAQLTESQQTFGQVALIPKTVGAYTELTRQLLLQSNPAADMLVMDDLARVVSLAIDSAGINGSGASGQPTGVLNTAGIGSVVGTSIDHAKTLEFQTDVLGGNAMLNPGATGYVTTAAVAALLAQRVKFTSTASPLWEGNLLDGQVSGFKSMSSGQIPAATMLFGDFSQVVVGEWGMLEVEVNPYADFKAGTIGVRAFYSVDIAVRHAGSFSAASSIT